MGGSSFPRSDKAPLKIYQIADIYIYAMAKEIEYSEKYCDDSFEYRHVILPRSLKNQIPRNRLMSEQEWRGIGVTQSRGWMHYMLHSPEPHILLFRRPIGTNPQSGKAPANWKNPGNLTEDE